MLRLSAFLLLASTLLPAAAGESAVTPPFTHANPILFQGKGPQAEVRDPCIIRDGGLYYMVFTVWPFTHSTSRDASKPDFNSPPGIKLFSSPDLQNWKFEQWLVKSSELPEACPYKHRFWAPEIHKLNGRYYLIFTADNWIKDEYNKGGKIGNYVAFVGVADKITGPYEHITWLKGAGCDTTLFGDTDGKIYALMPYGDLFIQEADLGGIERGDIKLVGERRKIVTCDNSDIGLKLQPDYLEGPWMIKRDGRYILFYAAAYLKNTERAEDKGYWTGAAYAGSIMGPYAKDLRGRVFWGGHLAVFDGPDGRPWFSYRGESAKLPETHGYPCIDPFEIVDGRVSCGEPSSGPVTVRSGADSLRRD